MDKQPTQFTDSQLGSQGHVYFSPQTEVSEATTMHDIVQIHKSIVDYTQFIAKVPAAAINHIERCPQHGCTVGNCTLQSRASLH